MTIIGGVDWSDAPEPVQLEAGEYEVRVGKAQLVPNKSNDGSHVACELIVFNNENQDMNGKVIFHNFSTSRGARWRFIQFLTTIGMGVDDLESYDELNGAELKVQVVLKSGQPREGERPEDVRRFPEVSRFIPLA